ncbi:hypothetical protein SAMN05216326_14120 [Nitrosomonas marina]|uniref:Uncharacterized protein n=1 Tax=Nitrosomonas marina TaxID=917 RepID=A0A1I0FNT8_9PROT|nr:hypothetical protein [Nitrosomonas marina]SET59792.1 hypothetical protein SAMN05216326_14120 [Nitrosomonas marina]
MNGKPVITATEMLASMERNPKLSVMLTYNLMSFFRQDVLRSDAVSGKLNILHTRNAVRCKLFAKAGCITKDGRKRIINLAVASVNVNSLSGYEINLKFDLAREIYPYFYTLKSSNGKSGIKCL